MSQNKINIILLSAIFCLVAFIGFNSFYKSSKIAYVDSAKLMEKSVAMQRLQAELKKEADQSKSNIDTLVMEFENTMKSYEKKLATMSMKEKEMATELLKNKQSQLIQYQQALKQKTSQSEQLKTQEVLKVINDKIAEYGKKKGCQIIFATSNGNIAYADETINITDDVVEIINK